jgi:hypothetical protein
MAQRIRRVFPLFFLVPLMLAHVMPAHSQWKSDPSLNNAICQEGARQHAPRIVTDGNDGAIICWYDERNSHNSFDIYAQRVDKDGFVRWTVNGIAVCSAPNAQLEPEMVSDGAGGAIIVWTDARNGDNDIFAQRIDSSGKVLWAQDGVPLTFDTSNQANPKLISDGRGGAIVTWNAGTGGFPPGSKIYAQRIDASGTLRWGSQVLVSGTLRFSNVPSIASDGQGGAYIAYAYYPRPEYDVYAQRLDSNGTVLWAARGVGIATGSGTQDSPLLVADGAGNAFLGYLDWGAGSTPNLHVVVLKPDGTQAAAFRATSTSGGQTKHHLSNIGTGLLGIVWEDGRVAGKKRVYAQIIDNTGNKLWTANGVEVSNRSGDQELPYVASDGAGGVFVAWEDKTTSSIESDIYMQRLSGVGAPLWPAAGKAVSTAPRIQMFAQILRVGQNDAIVTWEDFRPSLSNPEIYASKILADGSFPIAPPMLSAAPVTVSFGAVGIGFSSTRNVTLTNSGGEPLTITSITSNDPHFSLTPDNNTIAPSGSVTAVLRFEPTTKTPINATIVVESNSVLGPVSITAGGWGTGTPELETDKSSLNFGNVPTGSSKAMALRISNPGNDTLVISNIASNNPRFTVDVSSMTILPGGSFDDTVRFSPTAAGPVSASLTLTSNAPTSPKTVGLSGTGATELTITIDPADVDFGDVSVGASKDATVTISNNGNEALNISAFTCDDSRFTLETALEPIPAGGAKPFTLRFTPDMPGPMTGTFTVSSNAAGSPHAIPVSGTGVADEAGISFSTMLLTFGEVEVGKDKDLILTVGNPGNATLNVSAITSTNADFSVLPSEFEVPTGGSQDVAVRFAPGVIGDREGWLVITSNAAGSPDTVSLSGMGTDVSAVRQLEAFPGTFTLYQNYPNPFHPSTTIRYDLETAAPVRLTVLNALGKVVATLLDETQAPGLHVAQWIPDARSTPGVYFYVLRVGARESFGTMVLMK